MKHIETLEERYAKVMANTLQLGNCRLWQGRINKGGYGVITWRSKSVLVHRFVYAYVNLQALEDDYCVLHRCDNPACCNANCLFSGDRNINNKDRVAKGRKGNTVGSTCFGEINGKAKLTIDDVTTIKSLWASGSFSQTDIAKKFGIHQTNVHYIVSGKTWGNAL